MSAHVVDKAQRLLAEGRVTEHHDVRAFYVHGASGARHTVVIGEGILSCSCEAGQRYQLCSHLLAARVLMDREQVAT